MIVSSGVESEPATLQPKRNDPARNNSFFFSTFLHENPNKKN